MSSGAAALWKDGGEKGVGEAVGPGRSGLRAAVPPWQPAAARSGSRQSTSRTVLFRSRPALLVGTKIALPRVTSGGASVKRELQRFSFGLTP
jgi:hypothetical protein